MCVGHARCMVIFSPSLLPIHRQFSKLIEKRKHMIQYKVTAEGGGRYRVQIAFPAHVFPFPFPGDTLNQQRTKKAGVFPNFISMLSPEPLLENILPFPLRNCYRNYYMIYNLAPLILRTVAFSIYATVD